MSPLPEAVRVVRVRRGLHGPVAPVALLVLLIVGLGASFDPGPGSSAGLSELLPDAEEATISARLAELEDRVAAFERRRESLVPEIAPADLAAMVDRYAELVEAVYVLSGYAALQFSADTRSEAALNLRSRLRDALAGLANRTLFFVLWWKELEEEPAARLLDELAGKPPGSYARDPVPVYLAFQRAIGTCLLDQWIPENPLSIGPTGYEGATPHGATTGAKEVVVDGMVIDSPEAVVEHLDHRVAPGEALAVDVAPGAQRLDLQPEFRGTPGAGGAHPSGQSRDGVGRGHRRGPPGPGSCIPSCTSPCRGE